MSRRRTTILAMVSLGIGLIAVSWNARGQQPAPLAMKGVSIVLLSTVDLGPEIDGLTGRQLRLRKITIEPGGFIELHSHKDRPGTVCVLEGKFTETRNGVTKDYGPGDTWVENKETNHRVENKGTTNAVLVAADIFKQP